MHRPALRPRAPHVATPNGARRLFGVCFRNMPVIDGIKAVADAVIEWPERDACRAHLGPSAPNGQE